ncbi:3-hydroxyacyl-CoA dehydrogenase NAD-binding domain-containing protein [Caldiplasma sukawensis]
MELKAGVIGTGTMGNSIAALFALNGFEIIAYDSDILSLERGKNNAALSLNKLNASDRISNIQFTDDMLKLSDCSFIVEAVPEVFKIKTDVYRKVEKIISDDAILASNTSTIPISDLSSSLNNKRRFIGTHFFNPPVLMSLVEVVMGKYTDEITLNKTMEIMKITGKQPVVLKKEVPGFIVNRINGRTFYETFSLIEEGFTPMEIDYVSKNELNFPMGMCQLIDYVGLDVIYYGTKELMERGFNTRINPSLESMFREKRYGVKTGRGFYDYDEPGKTKKIEINEKHVKRKIDPLRIIGPAINEAAWLVENGITDREGTDLAMKLAMNWPLGPFQYAERYGFENLLSFIEDMYSKTGNEWYRPSSYLKNL